MTRIAIDPARPVGRLDRKVFGGFVEHLGRCIYGGLYEEGSPLSDDRGFRKDVLGLLRELRLGVLRWHGTAQSTAFERHRDFHPQNIKLAPP